MARKKTKDWIKVLFSLNKETKVKIAEIAEFENMSNSELIDFLVENWDSGINPLHKIECLKVKKKQKKAEKRIITNEIDEIDDQIDTINKQILLFNEWAKQKTFRKDEAITVLRRLILDNRLEDAERASKTWQRLTGISAIELLLSAKEKIEQIGV